MVTIVSEVPWRHHVWPTALASFPSIHHFYLATPVNTVWPPSCQQEKMMMLEWTGQLVKHGSKLEQIEIAVMVDEDEKDGEEYFFDNHFEDHMEGDGEGEYYAVNVESDDLIDPEKL